MEENKEYRKRKEDEEKRIARASFKIARVLAECEIPLNEVQKVLDYATVFLVPKVDDFYLDREELFA